jgi:transposase InsO family protein
MQPFPERVFYYRRLRFPAACKERIRGSRYANGEYQAVPAANDILCAIIRKGECYDNSPMESFFVL